MEPTPSFHDLTVERTARVAVLGDPGVAEETWFVLHGYGQLAQDFLDTCRALAAPERALVAPEALSRFYLRGGGGRLGASWMTKHRRADEIDDYLRYLDAVRARWRPTGAVTLLGFSQGGATAMRWALHGTEPLARLVLWGAGPLPDTSPADARGRLGDVERLVVAGARDEAVPDERLRAELAAWESAGLPFERLSFEGGHRLDDEVLRSIAARR